MSLTEKVDMFKVHQENNYFWESSIYVFPIQQQQMQSDDGGRFRIPLKKR